jgi:hypothetical protein
MVAVAIVLEWFSDRSFGKASAIQPRSSTDCKNNALGSLDSNISESDDFEGRTERIHRVNVRQSYLPRQDLTEASSNSPRQLILCERWYRIDRAFIWRDIEQHGAQSMLISIPNTKWYSVALVNDTMAPQW